MRYDVCIIGAGAEGLSSAAWLASRGLKVIVVERAAQPGGRCITREFAPGFFASPYADELPAIPPEIFRAFDLARHGAILGRGERAPHYADSLRGAIIARVMAEADRSASFLDRLLARRHTPAPWPGEELASCSLAELAPDVHPHVLCDPALAGSALALLAGPPGGVVAGGLGALGKALRQAAREAGAEISCGLEGTDLHRRRGRVVALGLAGGSEIAARAVISTLDLKRTFLSLFAWNELPKPLVARVGAFRPAPGIARLLVALKNLPEAAPRRPIALNGEADKAYRAWCSGIVPERPPAQVHAVSAVDPFLAPDGAAVATVTLGAIPYHPFDGPWTNDKREKLRAVALKLLEEALPGAEVITSELIVPPDIESQLGLTQGDLSGGELSATQMLSLRPFAACSGPRTPVPGLYLAGSSSALGPLATCASGVAAARAVFADLKGAV